MQPLDDPLTGSPRLHLLGGARPNRASTWKYHGRPCLQPPAGRLRVYHGLGRPLAAHQQKYPDNPDMMRERAERDEEKRRERAEGSPGGRGGGAAPIEVPREPLVLSR